MSHRAEPGRACSAAPRLAFRLIRGRVSGFIDARQIDKIPLGDHVEIPVIHVFALWAGGGSRPTRNVSSRDTTI